MLASAMPYTQKRRVIIGFGWFIGGIFSDCLLWYWLLEV
jgi:hypothetical protein